MLVAVEAKHLIKILVKLQLGVPSDHLGDYTLVLLPASSEACNTDCEHCCILYQF